MQTALKTRNPGPRKTNKAKLQRDPRREVLRKLGEKIRLIRQEQFSGWAAIDGRYEDATPVRIKGEDVGEMRMKVVFTVGTRKGDLNRALVRALKEGFEARLLVASPRDP